MAFNIQVRLERFQKEQYNWHIQNRKPVITNTNSVVVLLQADGDELEVIRARFENVPITKGGICVWTGEMAKFIYNNLD